MFAEKKKPSNAMKHGLLFFCGGKNDRIIRIKVRQKVCDF